MIDVYVYKVENNFKGVNVFVSCSYLEFIKCIMEWEILEVFDGIVEIMSVFCEVGDCIKVVVCSYNLNVDVIGIIVGCGGSNIKKVISNFYFKCVDVKIGLEILVEENIDVI